MSGDNAELPFRGHSGPSALPLTMPDLSAAVSPSPATEPTTGLDAEQVPVLHSGDTAGSPVPGSDAVAERPLDAPGTEPAPPTTDRQPELSHANCARQLAERFPALFGAGVFKPIQLRVQTSIHERAPGVFSKRVLSVFLHRHTTSTPYIKALIAAAERFDLDGAPAGPIAPEHQEAARTELERRRALVKERQRGAGPAAPGGRPANRRPVNNSGPARSTPMPLAGGDAPQPIDRAQEAVDKPAERQARPGRPARSERPEHPNRPNRDRTRSIDAARPGPKAEGKHREDARLGSRTRPEGSGGQPHGTRPPTAPAAPQGPRRDAPLHPQRALTPEDTERRGRSMLLQAFEASPLSPSNFAALKGLTLQALESTLAQARSERGPVAPPAAPRASFPRRN